MDDLICKPKPCSFDLFSIHGTLHVYGTGLVRLYLLDRPIHGHKHLYQVVDLFSDGQKGGSLSVVDDFLVVSVSFCDHLIKE
jgi:hypothetical protein